VGSIRPASFKQRACARLCGACAASSSATIEIIQFPARPPGGGTFGFSKSVLAPAPKTWPKTVFETKLTDPVPERLWAQDSRVISPSTAHPKTPIPGATTFTVCDRCCREYVDRRGSLCFSVCASRAGLTPSPTCPSLGKVASAKAEMWPLRQPNGDATRQPSSVRTDGGFLHVSEHHSSAAR
jgi:hypothetical protein